jgi:hypothetical protein
MTQAERIEHIQGLIHRLAVLGELRNPDLEAINRTALELTWYSAGWRVNGK